MIIARYLTREIAQALLTVTLILVLAFTSQQLVRYLNYAAIGKIPTNVLLELVSFEVPYLTALLLPLGLYLGILLSYFRALWHRQSASLAIDWLGYLDGERCCACSDVMGEPLDFFKKTRNHGE